MAAPAAAPVGSAGVMLWPTRWTLPVDLHGGEAMSGSQIPASVWLARIVDAPRTRGKRRLRVCVAPVSRHLCANRGKASPHAGQGVRQDPCPAWGREPAQERCSRALGHGARPSPATGVRRASAAGRRRGDGARATALAHKMATNVRDGAAREIVRGSAETQPRRCGTRPSGPSHSVGARRAAGSGPDTARNTAAGDEPVRQGAGQARGAPGKGRPLLAVPPLRTVRAGFPAYGSSRPKAL